MAAPTSVSKTVVHVSEQCVTQISRLFHDSTSEPLVSRSDPTAEPEDAVSLTSEVLCNFVPLCVATYSGSCVISQQAAAGRGPSLLGTDINCGLLQGERQGISLCKYA